jgi:hypothetical protein
LIRQVKIELLFLVLLGTLAMTIEELQTFLSSLANTVANQERINTEAFKSLRETAESQARSIEYQRESIGSNAQMMADAIQLVAISQRTAAAAQETAAAAQETAAAAQETAAASQKTAAASQETAAAALELSANTSRNIDRLEQMIEILIRDNQADRARIRSLEEGA